MLTEIVQENSGYIQNFNHAWYNIYDILPEVSGSLWTCFLYIFCNVGCLLFNFPFTVIIPGDPNVGPIGIIAVFLLASLFFLLVVPSGSGKKGNNQNCLINFPQCAAALRQRILSGHCAGV